MRNRRTVRKVCPQDYSAKYAGAHASTYGTAAIVAPKIHIMGNTENLNNALLWRKNAKTALEARGATIPPSIAAKLPAVLCGSAGISRSTRTRACKTAFPT